MRSLREAAEASVLGIAGTLLDARLMTQEVEADIVEWERNVLVGLSPTCSSILLGQPARPSTIFLG